MAICVKISRNCHKYLNPLMPGGIKAAGLFKVCVTFLLPPGIKRLSLSDFQKITEMNSIFPFCYAKQHGKLKNCNHLAPNLS